MLSKATFIFWPGLFFVASLPLALILVASLVRLSKRVTGRVAGAWSHLIKKQHWPTLIDKATSDWERKIRWAGYRRQIPHWRALALVAGFGVVILAILGSGRVTAAVLLTGVGTYGYVAVKARQARERCVAQIPDMLQSLVDSLRAGFSLPQAIAFVSGELLRPIHDIVDALVRADELRLDFLIALKRVANQINLPEWTLIVETMEAQQAVGGNIIPLIEEIGKTIRQQITLAQEVKTSTAAGRMSGWIIAGLVPFLLVFFFFISPAYIAPLFTSTLGQWLVVVAAILEVVGFVWIYRLVRVDY